MARSRSPSLDSSQEDIELSKLTSDQKFRFEAEKYRQTRPEFSYKIGDDTVQAPTRKNSFIPIQNYKGDYADEDLQLAFDPQATFASQPTIDEIIELSKDETEFIERFSNEANFKKESSSRDDFKDFVIKIVAKLLDLYQADGGGNKEKFAIFLKEIAFYVAMYGDNDILFFDAPELLFFSNSLDEDEIQEMSKKSNEYLDSLINEKDIEKLKNVVINYKKYGANFLLFLNVLEYQNSFFQNLVDKNIMTNEQKIAFQRELDEIIPNNYISHLPASDPASSPSSSEYESLGDSRSSLQNSGRDEEYTIL